MPGSAFTPGGRGGEDDRAALAGRADRPHRRLQGEEGAVEIDREDPAPFGEGQVLDRPAGADAGIDDGVGEAGQVRVGPELLVGDVADQHLPLAGQGEGEIAQPVLVEVDEDQLARALVGDAGGGRRRRCRRRRR